MKACWLVLLVVLFVTGSTVTAFAQSKRRSAQGNSKARQTAPVSDLARLRDEYIAATESYKDSLEKLRLSYEKSLRLAEDKFATSSKLYDEGLISRVQLDGYEHAVIEAKAKVAETDRQKESADSQIANVILETRAEKELAKKLKLAKGGLITTTWLLRYNGASGWTLSDAWKIQSFFSDTFKRALPVAVFGQGAIHDRWRLDHRNAMDINLHPDSPEGQALLSFLQRNAIPFSAFRQAIPGTATGPHIHIGRPSHRY
jgi:hypothetical protein